jgi:hypothetical protein
MGDSSSSQPACLASSEFKSHRVRILISPLNTFLPQELCICDYTVVKIFPQRTSWLVSSPFFWSLLNFSNEIFQFSPMHSENYSEILAVSLVYRIFLYGFLLQYLCSKTFLMLLKNVFSFKDFLKFYLFVFWH